MNAITLNNVIPNVFADNRGLVSDIWGRFDGRLRGRGRRGRLRHWQIVALQLCHRHET